MTLNRKSTNFTDFWKDASDFARYKAEFYDDFAT